MRTTETARAGSADRVTARPALRSLVARAAVVALAVAVLSLAGPLTSAVSAAAAVVLVGLHLVVAAVLIAVLRRSAAER